MRSSLPPSASLSPLISPFSFTVVMDFYLFLGVVAATILSLLGIIFYRNFRVQENKIIASSSSPSSSPSPQSSMSHNRKHNVFPSFHGTDVRKAFLSHVLKEFQRKGIDSFIDNNIERSKSIGPELIEAIRGSRIAIVLLSKNYASSTWCMNELVEIMRCREELGQAVVTIFYEVDPTDVKKQTGNFGKIFEKTCKGKSKEDIGRWRHALAEVAKIAGYHSNNWDNEATMIENIATDISNKLNHFAPSSYFNDLVGMRRHMEKMGPLLRLDLDEVRMIGIWGPPGIGKTTIARFLFNQYYEKFELSVFMDDIKTTYTIPPRSSDYNAKLYLQKQFMSQIINQLDIKIPHLGIAQERLKDKKVLVVLDDVDRLVQLEAMVNETRWFGPWSRIIITTQDQKLLKKHKINHIYKVDFPLIDEALQIFCMYAFEQKSPKVGFEELAREVTNLVGKLPLGLRVMGSHFRGMSIQEWKKELPRFKIEIDGEIECILKFSYDALCDQDKDLFLHIACFFNHGDIEKVVEYLAESFEENVMQGLHVLAAKSLISISSRYIEMHTLLVQLGREIVRKQSVDHPRKRRFLVDRRDICKVLVDYAKGSTSVIGINFVYNGDELQMSDRAFEKMSDLKFLRLTGGVGHDILHLSHGLSYLSPKLRLLDWTFCPMTCLPSTVNLESLVELNLRFSKLERLWEGIKPLPNLKWMDLSYSEHLKELPDLSMATSLQYLSLEECLSMVKLPSSIGNATNLQTLNLSGCSNLVELPSSIGNATNLQKFDLQGCSSLVKISFSIGNTIRNLEELDFADCSRLVYISSIGNATNLEYLNFKGCSKLVKLHSSIGKATNLKILDFTDCLRLLTLPSSIGNATRLEFLDFTGCSKLQKLPATIGNLHNLKSLILKGCSKLEVLPAIINLKSLNILDLTHCSLLKSFPEISTNIECLRLTRTAVAEVPPSISLLSRITELDLTNTKVQELGPWVKGCSSLGRLVLNGMQKLVSVSHLPGSLTELDAENCRSLEKLDCSFPNPEIILNFINCFKLNKEARDVIFQTSTNQVTVLPGGEIPTYFTYRAYGDSLTVKLKERPFPSSLMFKACILLGNIKKVQVHCVIKVKQNSIDVQCTPRYRKLLCPFREHLYTFEFEVDVASDELFLEFRFSSDEGVITKCGLIETVKSKK